MGRRLPRREVDSLRVSLGIDPLPKKKPKAKRAKPLPANRLSVEECERRGWIAQVVESRIPHTFITRDLFGCIDIVAAAPGGIVGIQATGSTNRHGRRAKILAEPRMVQWLVAGAKLELWLWRKIPMGRGFTFSLDVERYGLANGELFVMESS